MGKRVKLPLVMIIVSFFNTVYKGFVLQGCQNAGFVCTEFRVELEKMCMSFHAQLKF